ncbi:putative heat shock protein HtpX [Candidatus Protochlamydia naegleriophila]|uniref:Putative heat shock protein HtpX n=1 Tax=Candidatus Protochlamydia naegleriophila TaxID=389348 RepID=A0A0U5JG07_9BACT|nr:M48 family metallopeptidase [Candidatus Protochlamydia naegleriophila]CUI16821.1 putative heat shock protein HtpX [Candidatus Protochlamydia naegleriophila]
MAMNFWEAQREAKSKTAWYLTVFFILTITTAVLAELAMRTFAADGYQGEFPYIGLAFLTIILGAAGFNYMNYLQAGGSYVAESVGAQLVERDTMNPKERQLLNIVEEIALATSLPVPPVYILEAQEINAFAAGTSYDNAAITVTRGCLMALKRDELQGVLAHEFGHIYNRDMLIGMRVAAMIMGFFIVSYIGLRMLQGLSYTSRRDDEDRKGGNPIAAVAVIFLLAGTIMWFFGSILQAMVSRQREFLADASSVQFTRNPDGIANALRKIQHYNISDMPKSGQAFSHLYFNEHTSFWQRLFASHPPIEERIAAIEGGKYTDLTDLSMRSTQRPSPPQS